MRMIAVAALALAAFTLPAVAQTTTTGKSQTECEADWKAADTNADGKLDTAERTSAQSMIPASLSSATADVMQQDFMTACTTGAAGTTTTQ